MLFLYLYFTLRGIIFAAEFKLIALEPFIVSARKYRPQTFTDVVGQQAITNTLTNTIDNK